MDVEVCSSGHNPGALGGAKGSGLLFDADTCSDITHAQDGDRSRFSVATDDAVPSIAAYTVDGGKLVAISLVFGGGGSERDEPRASFADIYAALRKQYGEPTKQETPTYQNGVGAKFAGHNLFWRGASVITVVDTPNDGGRTAAMLCTRAEAVRLKAAEKNRPNPFK